MTPVDILEWTMGWAWPVIVGLAVLMAWGLARFLTWDEKELSEEQPSGPVTDTHCVCRCD